MLTALPLLLAAHASKQAISECPFKMVNTAFIVDAEVNKKKVSLMFDTGFGGWTVLDDSINLGKPDGKMTLQDFVGLMEVPTVTIKSLRLGTMDLPLDESSKAVLTPPSGYTEAFGTHCDGIMGFSVIKNTITEINFEKSKFVFYPQSFDITKKVPDNKRTFLVKMLPQGFNAVELAVKTAEGKSMHLALDTGNSFYATTHKEVLDRVGIWPISRKPNFMTAAGVASGVVDSWYVRMPKLTIFGVPVESSIWDVIDLPSSSSDSDGTVGFGFLKNFNIIIDYDRRYVWLENFTGKVSDDEIGGIGMDVFWDQGRKGYVVYHVQEGSPAAKAGVKKGDIMIGVDGDEALNIGFDRMRAKLEGPPGSKVKIAMSRRGELYRAEVERVLLINDPKG
ncbi:MAG: PDZ domain-containing protein [Armatimonadetes bacterium]|nr:PDZ domain-containing protein [Armatimonadota bacterium]